MHDELSHKRRSSHPGAVQAFTNLVVNPSDGVATIAFEGRVIVTDLDSLVALVNATVNESGLPLRVTLELPNPDGTTTEIGAA